VAALRAAVELWSVPVLLPAVTSSIAMLRTNAAVACRDMYEAKLRIARYSFKP
jgi:hypothetical protein